MKRLVKITFFVIVIVFIQTHFLGNLFSSVWVPHLSIAFLFAYGIRNRFSRTQDVAFITGLVLDLVGGNRILGSSSLFFLLFTGLYFLLQKRAVHSKHQAYALSFVSSLFYSVVFFRLNAFLGPSLLIPATLTLAASYLMDLVFAQFNVFSEEKVFKVRNI